MQLATKKNTSSNKQRKKPGGRPDERSNPPSGSTEHEGATEDQVNETPAPAGSAFNDEPKQG
jgi:hypothetical protein